MHFSLPSNVVNFYFKALALVFGAFCFTFFCEVSTQNKLVFPNYLVTVALIRKRHFGRVSTLVALHTVHQSATFSLSNRWNRNWFVSFPALHRLREKRKIGPKHFCCLLRLMHFSLIRSFFSFRTLQTDRLINTAQIGRVNCWRWVSKSHKKICSSKKINKKWKIKTNWLSQPRYCQLPHDFSSQRLKRDWNYCARNASAFGVVEMFMRSSESSLAMLCYFLHNERWVSEDRYKKWRFLGYFQFLASSKILQRSFSSSLMKNELSEMIKWEGARSYVCELPSSDMKKIKNITELFRDTRLSDTGLSSYRSDLRILTGIPAKILLLLDLIISCWAFLQERFRGIHLSSWHSRSSTYLLAITRGYR